MKKLLLFGVLCLLPMALLFAQDSAETPVENRTLFQGNGKLSMGGFAGPLLHFTSANDKGVVLAGASGAVLLNRRFFVGGYGLTMLTENNMMTAPNGEDYELDFSHGGLWLGYVFFPESPVHFAVSSLVGFGETSLDRTPYDVGMGSPYYEDQFFVISPQAELELSLTSFMRFGVGAGFRVVSGAEIPETVLDNGTLSGPFASFSLKFGSFN